MCSVLLLSHYETRKHPKLRCSKLLTLLALPGLAFLTGRAMAQAQDAAASLPPIESIGPGTDIRPFLAPGVPADLTRAALRRAWSSDPAICDFMGLSENSWDFNAQDGVAGVGSPTADAPDQQLARKR
jgi:hypothetical protein